MDLNGARLVPREDEYEWAPWPGKAGYTARMTVARPNPGGDVVRRAYPTTLTLSVPGQPDRPFELAPAESFRPLGWSPSGRYFAVLSLADVDGDAPAPGGEILLLDPVKRQRTSETIADERWQGGSGTAVTWDGAEDRVWWFESAYFGEGEEESLAASVRSVDFSGELADQPAPGDVEFEGDFAGTRPDGPVFVSAEGPTQSWLVTGSGSRSLGTRSAADPIDAGRARLSARGELIFGTFRPSDRADFVREVRVSDADFRHERVIWRERVPNPILRALGLRRAPKREE